MDGQRLSLSVLTTRSWSSSPTCSWRSHSCSLRMILSAPSLQTKTVFVTQDSKAVVHTFDLGMLSTVLCPPSSTHFTSCIVRPSSLQGLRCELSARPRADPRVSFFHTQARRCDSVTRAFNSRGTRLCLDKSRHHPPCGPLFCEYQREGAIVHGVPRRASGALFGLLGRCYFVIWVRTPPKLGNVTPRECSHLSRS